MKRILIVEDDRALGEGLRLGLRAEDWEIILRRSLAGAGEALAEGKFDLVLLDVNLPDGSGLELLPRCGAPVILLTARDTEEDEILGLESGADDYITKPFSLAVLRARVSARLRREEPGEAVEMGRFYFDFQGLDFRREGRPLDLSRTEQKLLRLLVENRGRVLPRAVLIDRVWGGEAAEVDENALSVTVKRLRDKLEEEPSRPRYLKTVYGVGYTWVVDL
ncbi:MAG: response regulator transcription factor [Oscillibacter sp.]|nr:response regulator transcription factor [Oscillibacter sp.]